jgi:hypothetical protein
MGRENLKTPLQKFWKDLNDLLNKNLNSQKSNLTVEKFSDLMNLLSDSKSNEDFDEFVSNLSKKSFEISTNGNYFFLTFFLKDLTIIFI